jgi:hypothetical protein
MPANLMIPPISAPAQRKPAPVQAMTDREQLAHADRRIAQCEAYIAQQREIVKEAKRTGQDLDLAEEMLRSFERILRTLETQRDWIVGRLKDA